MFTGQIKLVPQAEEGLVDAAWFPLEEAPQALAYDTDQDIVRKAQEKVLGKMFGAPTHNRRNSNPRRSRIHT